MGLGGETVGGSVAQEREEGKRNEIEAGLGLLICLELGMELEGDGDGDGEGNFCWVLLGW